MVNTFSDTLFQLIKSLEKAEKRHFKLFIKRSSGNEDLKIIELFDALDKLTVYNEATLLKKLKTIQKPQLANIKVHLYKQVLSSLRLLKSTESIDLQLNEQFDFAHILYKKGLYVHSLKILEKAKETANNYHKVNFLLQATALEKRIETLHITGTDRIYTNQLANEIITINERITSLSKLSNLAMLLHTWFLHNGHAKNETDHNKVAQYFLQQLPQNHWLLEGFYEKLYLYQSYCWYAYINQNFLQYYRYSQKWVNLFTTTTLMIRVETGHYIKGLHTLLNALFTLRHIAKMEEVITQFETFALSERVSHHDNFRTQAFIYIHSAKINLYSITGQFEKGIALIPHLLQKLEADALFIDEHRIMIFNYKIATLYFGNGDYDKCIDYVQKIINEATSVRNDLQSYARILLLLAHYELGNYAIMEYLGQSALRFIQKKEVLTRVETALIKFLNSTIPTERKQKNAAYEQLYEQIKVAEKNKYESRAFAYLDVLSWLEAKINRTTMRTVLQEKYVSKRSKFIKNQQGLTIT